MKYIKTYEGIKFIDDNHRKLYNFSKRLERALNKYFNTNRNSPKYINVYATHNHSGEGYKVYKEYPIEFFISDSLDPNKIAALRYELDELNVKKGFTFELSIEQAEKLLSDLKLGIIEAKSDVKKYNL